MYIYYNVNNYTHQKLVTMGTIVMLVNIVTINSINSCYLYLLQAINIYI